jgi:hypothetical protein
LLCWFSRINPGTSDEIPVKKTIAGTHTSSILTGSTQIGACADCPGEWILINPVVYLAGLACTQFMQGCDFDAHGGA